MHNKKLLTILSLPFLLVSCGNRDTSIFKYLSFQEILNTYNWDAMPSIASEEDHLDILVVPVEFEDYNFPTNYKEDIEIAFNGESEDTKYWESVKSFFKKSSFNKLNLNFEVAEKVSVKKSTEIFTKQYFIQHLAIDAVETTLTNSSLNSTSYDSDGNGFIDAVWLIGSAPSSNTNKYLWPATYATPFNKSSVENPVVNNFSYASLDFLHSQRNTYKDSIDSHILIHETGHLLGLPDYYDLTNKVSLLGGSDMQDKNVGDHNAWTKYAFDWAEPQIVDTSKSKKKVEISIDNFQTGDFLLISNGFHNTAFDEFLVLELYSNEGLNYLDSNEKYSPAIESNVDYPQLIEGFGVKVYHVDARICTSFTNQYQQPQIYFDYDKIKDGLGDKHVDIGASNTPVKGGQYNYTKELFSLIEFIPKTPRSNQVNDHQRYEDLFQTGDTFSLKQYQKHFYNEAPLMNNGKELDITINFKEVTKDNARIEILKN